mgnify:CR=1 FL=1
MYDLAIVGGGPAGLSAALYAGRAGLSCVVLEKLFFGGQMLKTSEIDNYPGAPEIRDVFSFSESMRAQAAKFGAEFKTEEVVEVRENNGIKTITSGSRCQYSGSAAFWVCMAVRVSAAAVKGSFVVLPSPCSSFRRYS